MNPLEKISKRELLIELANREKQEEVEEKERHKIQAKRIKEAQSAIHDLLIKNPQTIDALLPRHEFPDCSDDKTLHGFIYNSQGYRAPQCSRCAFIQISGSTWPTYMNWIGR